jgi:hypothetical protein
MEIVLDLIFIGISVWCIVMYVRNTNKVIDDLIKQLKEKQKDEK